MAGILAGSTLILVMVGVYCCCVIGGVVMMLLANSGGESDEKKGPRLCFQFETQYGSGDVDDCIDAGMSRVESEEMCRGAAAYLGHSPGDPFQSLSRYRMDRPEGCYYASSKSQVFWNPGPYSYYPVSDGRYVICQDHKLAADSSRCEWEEESGTTGPSFSFTFGGLPSGTIMWILACAVLICVGHHYKKKRRHSGGHHSSHHSSHHNSHDDGHYHGDDSYGDDGGGGGCGGGDGGGGCDGGGGGCGGGDGGGGG